MKKIILFLFITCFINKTFSQNSYEKIDRYLTGIYNRKYIPGFSIAVIRNNEVIFSKAYGNKRFASKEPMETTTPVLVGSVTKSFTALAVLRLVSSGKIQLDDAVVKYIPWFKTANKDRSDKITIRMLLNNTSGIYSPVAMPYYDTTDMAIENYVRSMRSLFLYKEPGISYEYSNAGYVIAGLLVSKISGIRFSDFLAKNIFGPLGMSNTGMEIDHPEWTKKIVGHYPSVNGSIPVEEKEALLSMEYAPAGSQLISNSLDFSRYLLALINDKDLVIKQSMKNEIWKPQISFPGISKDDGGDGSPFSYGLGWMISTIDGREIIHHGGSTGKSSSFIFIDKKNKIAAVMVANIDLTFIDKYRYPTEIEILNNVVHLAEGTNITGYARPIKEDPTMNNFELSLNKYESYTGQYNYENGGDGVVYFGVDMKIMQKVNGQLEAEIYRGNQTVNRFKLDFINETVAVSRNLAMPAILKFKVNPKHEIVSVLFNGILFSKNRSLSGNRFREISEPTMGVSYKVPSFWLVESSTNGLKGSVTGKKNVFNTRVFEGSIFNEDSLVIKTNSNLQLKEKGKIRIEMRQGFLWKEVAYLMSDEKNEFICQSISTKYSGRTYWFSFIAPKQEFSDLLQSTIQPIFKSLRIR